MNRIIKVLLILCYIIQACLYVHKYVSYTRRMLHLKHIRNTRKEFEEYLKTCNEKRYSRKGAGVPE